MEIPFLVFYANPEDQDHLYLEEEEKAIKEAVKTPKVNKIVHTFIRNARTKDIHTKILEHKPKILYFAGHGDKNSLVFETYNSKTRIVKSRPLANALSLRNHKIKCVILNSCSSSVTGEKIASDIEYVIAMNGSINDNIATNFVARLLEEINHGESLVNAYLIVCNRLDLQNSKLCDVPMIFVRGNKFNYRDLMYKKTILEVCAIRLYQGVALSLSLIFVTLMYVNLYSGLVAMNTIIPLLGFESHMRHYYQGKKIKREFKNVNFL